MQASQLHAAQLPPAPPAQPFRVWEAVGHAKAGLLVVLDGLLGTSHMPWSAQVMTAHGGFKTLHMACTPKTNCHSGYAISAQLRL